jgi:hypothetical protein
MKTALRRVAVTSVAILHAVAWLGCGAQAETPRPSAIAGNTGANVAVGTGGARSTGLGGNPAVAGAGNPTVAGAGSWAGPNIAGSGGLGATRGVAGSGAAGSSGLGGARGAAGFGGAGSAGSTGATGTGEIWMPKPGVTWQWQLTGTLDTSLDVQMYDIDLFTNTAATIQALHDAGRRVICYFSAGSYEPGRPDSAALERTGLGSVLDGWPDEKWLDIRSSAVRDIMKTRLDLAKNKACDGVEPDNVDAYANANGLGLTEDDQVSYNEFIAAEAHLRKLSVGLKNSLGLVSRLVSSFDWALNEECLKYKECDSLAPFIAAGKAVFHCEYGTTTSGICNMVPRGFSTIVKNVDLDAQRMACN